MRIAQQVVVRKSVTLTDRVFDELVKLPVVGAQLVLGERLQLGVRLGRHRVLLAQHDERDHPAHQLAREEWCAILRSRLGASPVADTGRLSQVTTRAAMASEKSLPSRMLRTWSADTAPISSAI